MSEESKFPNKLQEAYQKGWNARENSASLKAERDKRKRMVESISYALEHLPGGFMCDQIRAVLTDSTRQFSINSLSADELSELEDEK